MTILQELKNIEREAKKLKELISKSEEVRNKIPYWLINK